MSRLALLPLDDRPVNYDHPWWLGQAAGIEVRRPPRAWLGSPFQHADGERISEWLSDEAQTADALVVAVDTLAYGGLIPSRQSTTPLAEVVDSLEPLRAMHDERPQVPIYAFSILMRVNRSDSAEEEKAYWAAHGKSLYRLSYLDDKVNVGAASEAEVGELGALVGTIPAAVIDDYRAGRARNHAVNRLMVEWAESGILTYLVIAQDDTAPYGWNIAESRLLRSLIEGRGIGSRATVYPGADEVAGLLVASHACRQFGVHPKVFARYSTAGGPTMVTAYEDRPLKDLVTAHLGPLDGCMTTSPETADVILAVNSPTEEQAEGWLQLAVREPDLVAAVTESSANLPALRAVAREIEANRKDVGRLLAEIESDMSAGRNVAVVDVAFVNGGDLVFAEQLVSLVPLARLGAYAGWNTAGNSLGSGLAQVAVRAITIARAPSADVLAAHLALLAIHLLDDYVFQGIVRSQILLVDMPALGLTPSFQRLPERLVPEIEDRIERRMAPHVAELAQRLGIGLTIDPPTLPWQRVFEVAITPHVELK